MLRAMTVHGFLRGVQRFVAGFTLLQVAIIVVFVTFGPWWALHGGLAGAAALTASLGLLCDWRALDVLLQWLPRRAQRAVVRASAAAHFAALAAAGWLLVQPTDPAWRLLEGTDTWSDPILASAGDGSLVVLAGASGAALQREGEGWRDLGGPGLFAWEFRAGPGGSLWSAPREVDRIDVYEPGRGWRAFGRGGRSLEGLAVGTGELLAVIDGALVRHDMTRGTWSKVAEVGPHVRGVALAPDGDLALALARGGFWERRGGAWARASGSDPEVGFGDAYVGGGGWRYVIVGGALLTSTLYAAPPGEGFARVEAPGGELRILVAHPEDGRRIVVGSWGQGVWASQDGGRTWSDLGLHQVQVRALAVDWGRGTVCAGSSNLIFRRGVFCRGGLGQSSGLQGSM